MFAYNGQGRKRFRCTVSINVHVIITYICRYQVEKKTSKKKHSSNLNKKDLLIKKKIMAICFVKK